MLNKQNRKKNLKAYISIELAFWEKLLAFIILMMASTIAVCEPDIRVFIVTIPLWFIGFLLVFKARGTTKAAECLQEYGPLMVNHPEYTFVEYSKAVRRDRDTVTNEIEFMLKKKILFGTIDISNHKFIMDEDFSLRYVLNKERWNGAVFKQG
ncbi:hypothetical protein SAMN02910298_01977 [Pseudobutyrivibrio sp. YE44]|uniref:hypothetical protein n=1 Tax=Pseudobutyrivibrio sp. YE44 TaxID=1520802 RepID=UPI0008830AD8|nr:hypothetical protein [Pseudobutyrivibrio sp. YE44]SDB40338.1 hypothetical protein SAMN02910298_01977 [Pseudobutyrivibrio sp. YE44]